MMGMFRTLAEAGQDLLERLLAPTWPDPFVSEAEAVIFGLGPFRSTSSTAGPIRILKSWATSALSKLCFPLGGRWSSCGVQQN